jgi:membrane protein implicated in regulation of membrane protease activity
VQNLYYKIWFLLIIISFTVVVINIPQVESQNGAEGVNVSTTTEGQTKDVESALWVMGLSFAIAGAVLLILEAALPGFFIAIPGTVLVVLGVFGMVFPELFFSWISPLLALVVAIPATILTMMFYKRFAEPEPPATTVGDSLIGRTGLVIKDTIPHHPTRGKVKVGSQVWSATSTTRIARGKMVKVVGSEGVHIIVEELTGKAIKK